MHRIIKMLLVIFIFWLVLAHHLKAQDKPKVPQFDLPLTIKTVLADTVAIKQNIVAKVPQFDLPVSIKTILADTASIKKSIAEVDSLIKSLKTQRARQTKALRLLRSLAK